MRPVAVLALVIGSLSAACAAAPAPQGAHATAPRPAQVACAADDGAGARAMPDLESACRADPGCGCASLGHALLVSSDGAIDQRALGLLDGACRRGVAAACEDAALVAESCVRGTARASTACDALARDGRVPGVTARQPE